MTARITPGRTRDTGLLVQAFARLAGRVTGTEPPAVFLTLGRHRRLFWGWLLFAGALMPGGRLPRRETELVILRVATLSGVGVRAHPAPPPRPPRRPHRRRDRPGRRRPDADGLGTARPAAAARHRPAARRRATSPTPLWAELRAELDERRRIELVMLVGHYAMLATTLNTLRVEPDRPR